MDLISDALLLAASVGAAVYCYVLASRLRKFTTLEDGMGGAIAVLSAQVDDMTKALEKAQGVAGSSEKRLEDLTARADVMAKRLELLVASLHDLPEAGPAAPRRVEDPEPEPAPEEDPRRLRFVRRRSPREPMEAAE
ncbi:hypothetical protein LHP98_07290 [Rhodobacter sp. Har01]|uniref:hypothetical protein n=1 Tax=Rhodobacter sp. Har01 TaxID=2883999 RepID=UPI001D08F980|nr:hypothetical protein [Rhodobacter sp. Har01]MCB6177933.1 hypothetical protein [Rhodobacter sp. Har01]